MSDRLDRARKILGREGATDAEIHEWLASHDDHESLDLAFLAAAILEERGDTEGARRWYESIERRASQKADRRQRAVLGVLDARLRGRVTVWALAGVATLVAGCTAAVYGAFVLWLLSMSHAGLELQDPSQLAIVRWLSDTQTAELHLAASELGDPSSGGSCGGGGLGDGGSCGGGGGGSPRTPEAMLRALLEGFGGPRGEGTREGQRGGGGSGNGRQATNSLFDRPGGGGPPPRPLPPPPPTPPDPPEDITLGTSENISGPLRTCSAIERTCDPDELPPASLEVATSVESALVTAIAGLRDEGDCEGLAAVIGSTRAGDAWSIDRRLKALGERHLSACYLDRAEHGTDRTLSLELAQLHAERSACAEPDEAWRAYLMMVTGAMARDALIEAAGYLGCARRSVRDYQTVSHHPLDTAEAFVSLAAWEWGVMGNDAGFREAQVRATEILVSLDQSADIDRDDAVRLKLLVDAQWLESHAGAPEFAGDLERTLESPALEPPLHLVISALEVIHHLWIGERAAAAQRLSALIEVYEASSEAHPSWTWTGLEREVMEDPRTAGSDIARQVLVLTRVFSGPRTDAKVLELRGLLAAIGGAS